MMNNRIDVLRQIIKAKADETFAIIQDLIRSQMPLIRFEQGNWSNDQIPQVMYLTCQLDSEHMNESIDFVISFKSAATNFELHVDVSLTLGELIFEAQPINFAKNDKMINEHLAEGLEKIQEELLENKKIWLNYFQGT